MREWNEVGDGGALARSRWVYNCYLFPDAAEGRPMLVDVGLPSHAVAAAAWAAHRRPVLDTPVLALATHLHSDHVSGLPGLVDRVDARVGLPARARAYVDGEEPRGPGPRQIVKASAVFRSQPLSFGALVEPLRAPRVGYGMAPFALPVEHPEWLADGDAVAGAEGWEVIASPGHTDDSTSYYHRASRTLCSGDAVLSLGGRAWFNPEYVDGDLSAATEDRLRSLPVDVLLPGHGHPVVGRDLLSSARSFREAEGWIPSCKRRLARWRHRG